MFREWFWFSRLGQQFCVPEMFHASRAKAKDWQLDRVVINAAVSSCEKGWQWDSWHWKFWEIISSSCDVRPLSLWDGEQLDARGEVSCTPSRNCSRCSDLWCSSRGFQSETGHSRLPFAVFWNVMPMFQVILDISVTIVTLVLVMVPLLIASYNPQACNSAMRWMEVGERLSSKIINIQ